VHTTNPKKNCHCVIVLTDAMYVCSPGRKLPCTPRPESGWYGWYAMLRAQRRVHTNTSVSEIAVATYVIVGDTQQLVCPYLCETNNTKNKVRKMLKTMQTLYYHDKKT
jgi:hypothetical protein